MGWKKIGLIAVNIFLALLLIFFVVYYSWAQYNKNKNNSITGFNNDFYFAVEAKNNKIQKYQPLPIKLAIVGAAKNVASNLNEFLIDNIKLLKTMAIDVEIIIAENDSVDGTKEIFQNELGANVVTGDSKYFHDVEKTFSLDLRRIQNIARARNWYLEELEKNPPDYVIVMDLDEVNKEMSFDYIYQILKGETNPGWSAIFSTQPCAYDIYAMETEKTINTVNWFPEGKFAGYRYFMKFTTYASLVFDHNIHKFDEHGRIKTYSAFGGLGIYKYSSIGDCRYDETPLKCEHVNFNKCISGKKYIDQRLLNKGANFVAVAKWFNSPMIKFNPDVS